MELLDEKKQECIRLLSGDGDFLKEREKQLILIRFFSEHIPTIEEIGDEKGISVGKERVRSLLEKSARKLRHPSRKKYRAVFLEYLDLLPSGTRKKVFQDWLLGRVYDLKLQISPISREVEEKLQEHWPDGFFRKTKPVYFIVPGKENAFYQKEANFIDQLKADNVLTECTRIDRYLPEQKPRKEPERAYEIECDTEEDAEELVQRIKRQIDRHITSDVVIKIENNTVFLTGRFSASFDSHVKKYYMEEE